MKSVLLIVETGSLETRRGGPATANLWLVIGGREFPSRGWNDFAVVVLGWWAAALLRLLQRSSKAERVSFMDGPHTVDVSMVSSGWFRFRALEGVQRGHETAVGCVPASEFATSLISQGRELLESCRGQLWWSADAEKLESSLELLERECHRVSVDSFIFLFAGCEVAGPEDFVVRVGGDMTSRDELFERLAAKLKLPAYFGWNWDALDDSLRDLHWVEPRRVLILHDALPALPENDLRTYLQILARAVEDWRRDGQHEVLAAFPEDVKLRVLGLLRSPDN